MMAMTIMTVTATVTVMVAMMVMAVVVCVNMIVVAIDVTIVDHGVGVGSSDGHGSGDSSSHSGDSSGCSHDDSHVCTYPPSQEQLLSTTPFEDTRAASAVVGRWFFEGFVVAFVMVWYLEGNAGGGGAEICVSKHKQGHCQTHFRTLEIPWK
ncbi:hypothetical protein E2542_SST27961 [Spatholobus suberectus]|nr:hypothetical protein E2542_SST27961 [Spatholobus suberectus]